MDASLSDIFTTYVEAHRPGSGAAGRSFHGQRWSQERTQLRGGRRPKAPAVCGAGGSGADAEGESGGIQRHSCHLEFMTKA